MIKKICLISLFIAVTLSGISYAEKARTKNIFIKPFTLNTGGTSFDFTDYMSEVIVEYKEYNLISDEEVINQQEAIERKMSAAGKDEEQSVREIMKMVDSDCIIYGSISKVTEGGLTISAVLLDRTSSSVRKTLMIKRDRYLDSAARAIAHYLLTKDESFIKKFQKDMKNKEEDILEAERDFEKSLTGIESDYQGQNACIQNSPFLRAGYGGFANTSFFLNDKVNEYYPSAQIFTGDVFFYRSRDIVGDGVDIYTRFFYKKYKADSKSYNKISKDMENPDNTDFDDMAAEYDPLPVSDLEMIQKGIDLGFRFVGTTYFLDEAWSFYLMFGGRYMRVSEKYSDGTAVYEKNLTGIGGSGGIGLEVTLNRYLGFFSEINTAYVPVGDNKINYDGFQLLIGVTLRTNHIDGPILGFL